MFSVICVQIFLSGFNYLSNGIIVVHRLRVYDNHERQFHINVDNTIFFSQQPISVFIILSS